MPPDGVAVSTELFAPYLERAVAEMHIAPTVAESDPGSSSSAGAAGSADLPPEAVRAAGFRVHRHSALLATGFETQRHTMFVEGRPTQVSAVMSSADVRCGLPRDFYSMVESAQSLSPCDGLVSVLCISW
jgi:hypothetical protein